MSVYYPEATNSLASTKVIACADVADAAAPDLSTEIGALSSVDLSLTIRDWNPQINVNSGQAPTRLGTSAQMPQEGLSQYQGIEIRYPYDPQADDTDPNNKAKALLAQGAQLDFVVRKGIPIVTAVAAGDHTETWSVRCGRQNRSRSGDANDEFGEYEIVQMIYPLKPEGYGVVVA